MHSVPIPDHLYSRAQDEAASIGITVSEYVARLIARDVESDHDHLFTASVVEELNAVIAGIDAGEQTYSVAEVSAFLIENKKAWLENRHA